ncbi:TPA: site-specific DNA-methyltransferase [Klebsiella pneumoniae]|uniref:Type II methyltransferase M.KpnI n=2 Tax=Klebsiella pneumoniae complex TaxID=3390273 RepID=MTK1_KLEPN|nr:MULTISPECIES: site-specific DNA-methyltransferase [Klebsiella]P25238.1 RecName: Full=Type II methyltransferase M.KpnI; Short=M.KpnI; AltName: Full=Adenine-specific methyltransferase KpnI; AltName: Full=Modification methylase KpnI [Klebsiella pneumoniae]AAA25090.1 DNA methylase [Klebsiella pneumoniae]EKB66665.1 modification methylase KpnI [Klebsiella pneumoniae subsp. pneumoniae WGLW1]EKB75411.1 modification methylase KpnI [Klebsiella pneumoniae subsp. pneumoniae WGLW3]EKU0186699.1 site-spec
MDNHANEINKLSRELGLLSNYEFNMDELKNLSPLDSTSSSIYIGDNLTYLQGLSKTSPKTIDFCYIDPPYNTGNKIIYHDNRKSVSSDIFGLHNEWMSFLLPRLFHAHKMLKDTGIIAISIDDYEFAHLKILMDKIFGEDNFIGNIVVCRSKNGKGSKRNIASAHEYLLVYGKSDMAELSGQPDDKSLYDKVDCFGEYRIDGMFRKKGDSSLRTDRPNMFYPLYFNPSTGEVQVEPELGLKTVYPIDSKGIERRWLWSKETARERSWELFASKNGVVYVKNYSSSHKRIKVRTLWNDSSFYTERATNEITKIFGSKVFDTPKALNYIMSIINCMAKPDALILDFFAGSGTTAHAAAVLNSLDGGSRKTILMESNHPITKTHIAYKSGFRKISDITISRLNYVSDNFPDFKYKKIEII